MAKLLIIDDDPLTLDCFQYLFPSDQVEVLTANSAEAGLVTFREHGCDVVILDIRLPNVSGLDS